MRDIIKNIQLPIDGKQMDFRLTKLDAFSGAELLRLLAKMPEASGSGELLADMFVSMAPEDLRSVMVSCLNHVEVLLPAASDASRAVRSSSTNQSRMVGTRARTGAGSALLGAWSPRGVGIR